METSSENSSSAKYLRFLEDKFATRKNGKFKKTISTNRPIKQYNVGF